MSADQDRAIVEKLLNRLEQEVMRGLPALLELDEVTTADLHDWWRGACQRVLAKTR